jgi:hypothetical protein
MGEGTAAPNIALAPQGGGHRESAFAMHTRAIALVLFLAFGLPLAGCGDDLSLGELRTIVRDSAGIVIVENVSPDDSASNAWWRIEGPLLSIGGIDAEEPYALYGLTDGLRLDDGRIVVSSSGSDDIRYFDANGDHLRTSGRTGDGPGEFQEPNLLIRGPADSLFVADARTRRISVHDPGGGFVRLYDVGETASVSRILGRFGDGSLLAAPFDVANDLLESVSDEIRRPPLPLVRVVTGTAVPDTLGQFPGGEAVVSMQTSGGQIVAISVMKPAFGKSPTFAARGSEFYVGGQDGDEILVHDTTGALVRIIRTGRAPERVTSAHLDAVWERRLAAVPEERRAQVSAARRDADTPEGDFVPAYGEIDTDTGGNLWVADFDDPTDPPGRWTVYDPEGRVLARIVLPETFDLYDAGDDWVLGRERDDLEVEYVRLYRIVR